jgi:ceramide glucosyltransferase
VVVGRGQPKGGNPKIANLMDMLPAARHEVLVISDSDMHVEPDYLAQVVATLSRPGIGLATCLYVGRPDGGLWSRLGAMGINHGFLPSVMVAEAVGRRDGCFGATLALTRHTLDSVGGLEALREQLADDYLLGAKVRARGQAIGLVRAMPSSVVHEPDLPSLFAHEVRWGRTLACIDRPGYAASVLTLPVPMGLLALAVAGMTGGGANSALPGLALAVAVAARLWAVRSQARSLGVERQPAWMVVARDVLSFAVQGVALCGRTVRWRGRQFRIGRTGALIPFGEGPAA